MIEARLTATAIGSVQLAQIVCRLERYIRFVAPGRGGTARRPPVRLHFTTRRLPEPFVVDPERGVAISTCDIEGVCRYAGIDERTYLLICSLVGIAHWRVLTTNPLLQIEDLKHPPDVRCVYTDARHATDFALLLDSPVICRGCREFYHCLGADTELLALREVIAELPSRDEVNLHGNQAEKTEEFESDV